MPPIAPETHPSAARCQAADCREAFYGHTGWKPSCYGRAADFGSENAAYVAAVTALSRTSIPDRLGRIPGFAFFTARIPGRKRLSVGPTHQTSETIVMARCQASSAEAAGQKLARIEALFARRHAMARRWRPSGAATRSRPASRNRAEEPPMRVPLLPSRQCRGIFRGTDGGATANHA